MFAFKPYIKVLMTGVLAFGLWSCKDAREYDMSPEESPQEFTVPEGMQKLTIRIPNYDGGAAQFGTRGYNPDEEGYMSNLYVVAIKCANVNEDGQIVANVDDETGDFLPSVSEGQSYTEGTLVFDTSSGQWNVRNRWGQILKTNVEPADYMIPNDQRRLFTYSINSVGEEFRLVRVDKNESDYHTFNLALYPGLYRFGIIANADLYVWRTNKITEFKREEDLRDLILYFSEDTPLTPMHLPMVCHPEEMRYQLGQEDVNTNKTVYEPFIRDVQEGTNYVIPICHNYSTRVYSTLKFLCSKVRWTILFDKTPGGISQAFGNSWIRFNVDDQYKPIATKLRRYTRLFLDNTNPVQGGDDALFIKTSTPSGFAEDDPNQVDGYTGSTYQAANGWWSMNIDRFYWSEEGANYPVSPKSELRLWDKSTDVWIQSKQKVWQGIVYLPENVEDNRVGGQTYARNTVLEFPYHTRVNDNDDTPEVPADEPKRIYLFGNPNEKRYEGLNGDNYNVGQEVTEEYKLERNYFYDVVAKVVNPEADMDIQVFVSILPWHDIDQNIPESSDQNAPKPEKTILDINAKILPWEFGGIENEW